MCANTVEKGVSVKKYNYVRLRYRQLMKALTLEPDEYDMLRRAFQGGFTHANPFHAKRIIENITSYDFTSSYPAVMVAEKFPMSKGEWVDITTMKQFRKNLKLYCCVFDVKFIKIRSKCLFESYISESRCWGTRKKVYANNGRVVSADLIQTTITEQDYEIIENMYEWDSIEIGRFIRYRKGYLPTDFVKSILKLYSDKTQLKGVKGKEVEYLNIKEMANASYGMTVCNVVREEYRYDDTKDSWDDPKTPDIATALKEYNTNSNRFLFYPWGVWVTAYARRNLFTAIFTCQNDYVYSDTDSVKIRNADRYKKYFEEYNKMIIKKLEKACDFHKIPYDMIRPKTIKGIEKPLGVWDFDGFYYRFKTLGAKRYLTETDDGLHLTVSGLNKKRAVWFLAKGWKYDIKTKKESSNPFNKFSNRVEFPDTFTGKLTHTYIDTELKGTITDYMGNVGDFYEKSCVHLEPASYNLSMAQNYIDYLESIENEVS